jgi:hypothetical protein
MIFEFFPASSLKLLSNMIWEIDIKGAKPETEHQMVKHLEEIGVKKGNSTPTHVILSMPFVNDF